MDSFCVRLRPPSQIFRATGDVEWLRSAYDTVVGVADWIKSRVTPKDVEGK